MHFISQPKDPRQAHQQAARRAGNHGRVKTADGGSDAAKGILKRGRGCQGDALKPSPEHLWPAGAPLPPGLAVLMAKPLPAVTAPTRTRRAAYVSFCRQVEAERGRCDSCGHTAAEVGQTRLHVHYLMAVAVIGLDDPATTDAANTLLVCNACHSLMHPGKRFYDWNAAGRNRGFRL